jgi:hypothetical protein
MPMDSANTFNWLYLLILLPAAIYYGIKIFDRFSPKKSAQTDSLAAQTRVDTRVGSVLKIEQRELGNKPPFILSFALLISAILLFTLGVLAIYTWIAGIAEFRISYEIILFLIFFIGFPLYIFVDQFLIQPKYYKLGKSLVAKEARLILANNADAVFDACYQVLNSMKATINIVNKPTLLKATVKDYVMTIKIRRIKGSKVGVYVLSDSKWLTVKFDAGANKRNIDTFLKELSKK